MKTVKLYKYTRADGGTTVSPIQPAAEVEYTEMSRLIADEGMILTNGDYQTSCIDVYSPEGWTEIEAPEKELSEEK